MLRSYCFTDEASECDIAAEFVAVSEIQQKRYSSFRLTGTSADVEHQTYQKMLQDVSGETLAVFLPIAKLYYSHEYLEHVSSHLYVVVE